MDEYPAGRVRKALLFLLVCALHGVLGWLLLATSRVRTLKAQVRGFELFLIAPAPASQPIGKPGSAPAAPAGPAGAVSRRVLPRAVGPRKKSATQNQSSAGAAPNAITPPIDWEAELSRAGRASSGIEPGNPSRAFDFPKQPPTMANYPQFDWDYARTHRVESLPQGGIIIHLNDNCVIVLNPLPAALCSPFKREANGELFKHMLDPDNPGDARIP